jgi:hypothetical protein
MRKKPMTKKPCWIQSTLTEASDTTTKMPWKRGLRRQAFIASRSAVAALADTPMCTARRAA